jgi:hypothetical protein
VTTKLYGGIESQLIKALPTIAESLTCVKENVSSSWKKKILILKGPKES